MGKRANIDYFKEQQFLKEGYCVLKAFLQPRVLQAVREELNKLMDTEAKKLLEEGEVDSDFREEPFETRMVKLFQRCPQRAPYTWRMRLNLPGFFHLFFHPELLDVVEQFLGPEIRLYPAYNARAKLPYNKKTEVLWHQDSAYTKFESDRLRMITAWTPVVPCTYENGAMQIIPGTHKAGRVRHVKKEHYLEIDENVLVAVAGQATHLEVIPGDVVLLHNMLFHRGLLNRSNHTRWNMDWRYQDATQPTMCVWEGSLARSRLHPERTVRSPEQWASMTFQ